MHTRIRQVRKEKGLNQDDFAAKVGLTKNFISLVESGKRDPSARTVSDICRVFGVNPEWMETGEGEMFQPSERAAQIAEQIARVMDLPEGSPRRAAIDILLSFSPEEAEIFDTAVKRYLESRDKA